MFQGKYLWAWRLTQVDGGWNIWMCDLWPTTETQFYRSATEILFAGSYIRGSYHLNVFTHIKGDVQMKYESMHQIQTNFFWKEQFLFIVPNICDVVLPLPFWERPFGLWCRDAGTVMDQCSSETFLIWTCFHSKNKISTRHWHLFITSSLWIFTTIL